MDLGRGCCAETQALHCRVLQLFSHHATTKAAAAKVVRKIEPAGGPSSNQCQLLGPLGNFMMMILDFLRPFR